MLKNLSHTYSGGHLFSEKDPWSITDNSTIVVYYPYPGDPTYVGTTGANTFNIAAGSPNIVFGLGGNDTIKSAGGNNFIYSGDFTTKYSTGNDTITLLGETSLNYNYINYGNGNGAISIIAGNSQNFIMGGIGNDKVTVTTGTGTVGSTTTDLGPGNNSVKLGGGNDTALVNVPMDGLYNSNYDAGAGTDTLSLAFASVADLSKFTSVFTPVFGTNFINFAAMDASTFNFGKYDSQLGFQLNIKVTHFEKLVLDVNPTAVADTTIANVGLANIPSTPFVLANDVGYLGHTLNLSAMSAPVSNSPYLIVTADYAAFVPTLGNPLTGEFATFDLTPQGSSQHALLTLYNNGNYSISNVAALDSVIQANPGIHLSFNYTNGDGFGGHASSTGTINFVAGVIVDHDVITPIQSATTLPSTEGSSFSLSTTDLFNANFVQTENDPYTLVVSNLPAGLTYNDATGITGTPTVEQGSFSITVTATNTDPNELTHSSATNSAVSIVVNDAPDSIVAHLAIPASISLGTEGTALAVPSDITPYFAHGNPIEAEDPIHYVVTGGALPVGMTLSPDGQITGTPTEDVLSSSVQITATSQDGATLAQNFTFVINDAPDSIVGIAVPPLISLGREGTALAVPYDVTPYFIHGNPIEAEDPIHYAVTGGALPVGMTLSLSGQISGTPTGDVFSNSVQITATSQDGAALAQNFTFVISDAPDSIVAHLAIPASISLGTEGTALAVPYDITVYFAHGDPIEAEDTINYSLTGGALPVGMTLSPTGQISGTPTGDVLSSSVQITAISQDGAALTQNFTFAINDAHNEVSTNAPISLNETAGVPLSNVSVAGLFSSDDTLAFSIDPASASLLPAGLSLDATTGAITGTITAGAGTYVVTIDATNKDPSNVLDPVVPNTITFNVASSASITIDNLLLVPEKTTIPLSPPHHGNLFAGDGVLVGQLSDTASGTAHYSVIGGAFLNGSAVALAVNPFEVIGDSLVLIPGDSVPIGFSTAMITIDDGLGHQQNLTLTENTSPSFIVGSATGNGTDGSDTIPQNGTNVSASISDTSANDLLIGVNGGNGGAGGSGTTTIHGGNGGSGSYLITSLTGHDTIYGGDGGIGGNSISIIDKLGQPSLAGDGGAGTYTIDASANPSGVVIYGGNGGNGGVGSIIPGSIESHGGIGHYSIIGGAGNDIIYAGNGGNENTSRGIGGADGFYTIQAGSGDDTIFMGTGGTGQSINGAGHYNVSGGAGNDTIHLDLNSSFTIGMSIDGGTEGATLITDTPLATATALVGHLTNITHLDLTTTIYGSAGADAANTVALSAADVLNMTPASHTLFVEGTSNDTVMNAGSGWTHVLGDTLTVAGLAYDHYTTALGTEALYIEQGVHTVFS